MLMRHNPIAATLRVTGLKASIAIFGQNNAAQKISTIIETIEKYMGHFLLHKRIIIT